MSRNTEMPNLFVIGAEKCGTTSLHFYLGLHPEVSMSSRKEPSYFARPSGSYRLIRIGDREEYLALFEPGKAVRGEVSPAYSTFPELNGVPGRIAAETQEPKFIYLVRDPVERIESALRHWASFGRLEVNTGTGQVEELPENLMLSRSRYMTQIEQYLQFFPPESILVVDSDHLRDDRSDTLAGIFDFIGVDPGFSDPGFREVWNPATDHRLPPPFWRRVRSTWFADAAVRAAPDGLRLRARRFRDTVSSTRGNPIPEVVLSGHLRHDLVTVLRPEVEALREFTGQDFEGWSI